ncbi:MAG: VOC family protein, partial [Angustibacter sp.]
EVVEVLDHPASLKAPFGQVVRQRSANGGGWLGWVVEIDDIKEFELRLGRPSAPGSRFRPDGVELRWRQIGINGMLADPQLPFLVQWQVPRQLHPSALAHNPVQLTSLTLAGDPQRISAWLSNSLEFPEFDVAFVFESADDAAELRSCTFQTGLGAVTI